MNTINNTIVENLIRTQFNLYKETDITVTLLTLMKHKHKFEVTWYIGNVRHTKFVRISISNSSHLPRLTNSEQDRAAPAPAK